MSLQTSIVDYFNRKKRTAQEDLCPNRKVLILEDETNDAGDLINEKTIIYKESPKSNNAIVFKSNSAPKLQRKTPKTATRPSARKERQKSDDKQTDIRRSLLPSFQETQEVENEQVNVPFIVKGLPSPKKVKQISLNDKSEEIESLSLDKNVEKNDEKESLSDIKAKLIKSTRLDKLKQALDKVNKGREKLQKIQDKKSPCFKKFKTIEIEVPASPSKNFMDETKHLTSPSVLRSAVFRSPSKFPPGKMPYISPRKLFESPIKSPIKSPVKSPMFQRYYNLASAGKPALVLPFKYRCLAELFRSIDTVVSIMYNRKETIFFEKLKSSVQQMSKKNLTENILGQIKNILPSSYAFEREKRRMGPNQNDKYELVVSPLINTDHLGPSVLLERCREFYKSLLDLTKDHHEIFIQSLNPPLSVSKDKLTRWHPEFDVDNCPDIPAASMPEMPEIEKLSTAKDVLTKARDMIATNTRMEKALERLNEKDKSHGITPASQAIPGLAKALKGIPKSLLEKVRARQAAKAAELLTRPPEETQRRVELTRLPEIARILRNLFVLERKNVISKYTVVEKIRTSHREPLAIDQLEKHLQLLKETIPGWLNMYEIEGEPYVKLDKDANMSNVMTRLQELITKNQVNA